VVGEVAVSNLRFTAAATAAARADGLLGWISVTLAGVVRVDGIAVRRALKDGALLLSWPARRDGRGRSHPIVLPLPAVRDAIHREVLDQVRGMLESLYAVDVKSGEPAP